MLKNFTILHKSLFPVYLRLHVHIVKEEFYALQK